MNMEKITTNGKNLQEWKDWWIDSLIARGIPMLENRTTDNVLTPACECARARGAKLIRVEEMVPGLPPIGYRIEGVIEFRLKQSVTLPREVEQVS
jgi:hypothetical protein